MKAPNHDTLSTAIAWLRCNEGDSGEAEACQEVAEWLEERQAAAELRKLARHAGVPVARLRERLSTIEAEG